MAVRAHTTVRVARAAARRAFARDLVLAAGRSLLFGAVAAMALVGVDKLAGGIVPWWVLVSAPLGLAAAFAAAWAARRVWSPVRAAGELDRALGLKGRLSSAIELQEDTGAFADWAVEEAERSAAKVPLSRVLPLKWEWTWIAWPVLAAGGIAAALLIAPIRWPASQQDAAGQQVALREEAAEQVEQAAAAVREALDSAGRTATPEQLLALEELHEQLAGADPAGARAEAARRVEHIARDLERHAERQRMEHDELRRELATLARDGAGPEQPQTRDESARLAEALERADVPAAEEAARQLSEQMQRLSPQEREAIAQELRRLAEAVERRRAETPEARPSPEGTLPDELRRQGVGEEQIDELSRQTDPDEIARELERTGMDEEAARRAAERLARENQQRQAQREAMRELERLEEALRETADELQPPEQPPERQDPPDAQDGGEAEPRQDEPGEEPRPGGREAREQRPQPGQEPPEPRTGPPGAQEQPGQPEAQPGAAQDERQGGEPEPTPDQDGDSPGAGERPDDGRGLERLQRQLKRLAGKPDDAEATEQSARDLRRTVQEMLEGASPEEREQMRRWAEEMAREGGGERGAGDAPAQPADPHRPHAEHEPVDARPRDAADGPRDRIIAQWIGDSRPGERPEPGAMSRELRSAAQGAERAIEQQAVPARYSDLVRRVFRRYGERAEPAPADPGRP